MKNKLITTFLLSCLLAIVFLSVFQHVPLEVYATATPYTVVGTESSSATRFSFQEHVVYANGSYRVFYSDPDDGYEQWYSYASSTDGSSWSVQDYDILQALTGHFSVFFDGTFIHRTYYGSGTTGLYYCRGSPNSDESISWGAEQTINIGTGVSAFNPCITVDDGGHVWIGYKNTSAAGSFPYVIKNGYTNETWSTASGFPYKLSTTDSVSWAVEPISLTGGKVYVVYCRQNQLGRGRLSSDGLTFGSEETISSYNIAYQSTIPYGYSFSASNIGDEVQFVYLRYGTYQIRFNTRNIGAGWQTEELVQDSVASDSVPAISIDTSENLTYCLWAGSPTANHIYYKQRSGGTWSSLTDWIDESTNGLSRNDALTCSHNQLYWSSIGVQYLTNNATTGYYNVRFAFLPEPPSLLTFNSKYVISSQTAVTTTSATLVNDTQASQTFLLGSSKVVLAIYAANNIQGAAMPGNGMQNAISVDGVDHAISWDSGGLNNAVRNTVFWVGTLASGSHTVKGRFASNTADSTATISNRVLVIMVFDGDEFEYVDDTTWWYTTSTSFVDDPYAQATFTPSGACKAFVMYNAASTPDDEPLPYQGELGKKAAVSIAGVDYGQAEKAPGTGQRGYDSVFTCHALNLSAVETTVKGRIATCMSTETVATCDSRQLAVLLLADSTLMDVITSTTQVSTNSATLVDDTQATISRTTSDTREVLVVAMGTKRAGTDVDSTAFAPCYGIKIDDNERANSRSKSYTGDGPQSASTGYAEQLSAGSHTVQGRFSRNTAGSYYCKIDARQVVALWFVAPPPITITLATTPLTSCNVRLDSGTWYSAPHDYTDITPSSSHSIEVQDPYIVTPSQEQYVWASWSDSGANPHNVAPATNTTYTATMTHQWYFLVSSTYDSPTGTGWYNAGSSCSGSSVTTPVSGGAGIRYQTTGWTGTGSLSSGGTYGATSTDSFTINAYSTCTWNWITQYQPTITLTGTTSSLTTSITARTLNGASNTPSGLYTSWSDWCDSGTTLTFNDVNTGGGSATERLHTVSTRSWTVSSAFSATITYIHQWKPSITLGGTLSGDTVDITVRTLDGSSATVSGLYTSWNDWCDDSTTLTFSATSTSGKQCRSTTARSWTVSSAFSATPIWDRIHIDSLGLSDTRINANGVETSTLYATASLEYDSHALGSGDSLTISGLALSWVAGNSRFEGTTVSSSSVTSTTYNAFTSGNEATHGITAGNINSKTATIIWDKLQVQSYSVSDSRDNINDAVTIDALIWFDYDDTVCTTATITINGYSATHQGSGVYRLTRTSSTVTSVTYNTVACSAESSYGITTVDQNSKSAAVIWDRVVISILANSTNPDAGQTIHSIITATYEYGGAHVISWTVNILRNGTHFAAGNFTDYSAGNAIYHYTTENVTENTYGLTVYTTNTLTVVWANLFVEIDQINIADSRINIGTQALAYYHCRWSSNLTSCTTGTLYVNGTNFSINGTGWATATFTFGTVTKKVLAITDVNVDGVTSYGQIPADPEIIWDEANVYYFTVDHPRVDINSTVEVRVSAMLSFDSYAFGSGDTVKVNGTTLTWDAVNNWFEVSFSKSTIGQWTFTVTSVQESIYTITSFSVSVSAPTAIWDKARIYYEALNISRVDITAPIEFRVKGLLLFDNTPLGSGDVITANFGLLTWDATHGWFKSSRTQASVGNYTFTVSSLNQAYGITVFEINVTNPTAIWDRLSISFSASATNPKGGQTVNINWTINRQYDNSIVTSFVLNVTQDAAIWLQNWTTHGQIIFASGGVWHTFDCSEIVDNTYNLTSFVSTSITVFWIWTAPVSPPGGPLTPSQIAPVTFYGSLVSLGSVARGQQIYISFTITWVGANQITVTNMSFIGPDWSVTFPQLPKTFDRELGMDNGTATLIILVIVPDTVSLGSQQITVIVTAEGGIPPSQSQVNCIAQFTVALPPIQSSPYTIQTIVGATLAVGLGSVLFIGTRKKKSPV